jgi:hypothetical protein
MADGVHLAPAITSIPLADSELFAVKREVAALRWLVAQIVPAARQTGLTYRRKTAPIPSGSDPGVKSDAVATSGKAGCAPNIGRPGSAASR